MFINRSSKNCRTGCHLCRLMWKWCLIFISKKKPKNLQQRTQQHCLIEQILSYQPLFLNTVISINYAFSPVMNKRLHVVLIKFFIAIQNVVYLFYHCDHFWNTPPTTSSYSHPLVVLQKHSAGFCECHWVPFFSARRNSMAPLCLTFPCPLTFCQTAPPLPFSHSI